MATSVKGSFCLVERVYTIGLCVSRSSSEKSILRNEGKLGSNPAVKFSKGTWHHKKNRERARNYSKSVNLMSIVLARLSLRRGHKKETLHQERCARRAACDLAKNIHKIKNAGELRIILLLKLRWRRRILHSPQKNENSW